ncbi:hypothetical protein IFM46972_03685 [Aspergillus udagawae]|uniref:Uncharacterized protein n=1 Tax=Aspergillus udagawae TaxID=91492 RepID=A0A8H3NJD5_9EURO|nr:hypothetical protein IFM46972_03685 [Aspergillus udagawae]
MDIFNLYTSQSRSMHLEVLLEYGRIRITCATLDLAVSCTTFFSQRHDDVDTLGDDDGFTGLLLKL